ncbi:glycoside hydrolase family 18 protein [Amylocystis lapponica]|nr:glycoside hydrolase family 18 protein [Amylocystis lapponica]
MVVCTFSRMLLATVLCFIMQLGAVLGAPAAVAPIDMETRKVAPLASIPSAPRFAAYWDAYVSGVTGAPSTSDVNGYNVLILAFLLTEGAWDNAESWTQLTSAQRSSIKSSYSSAGIALMVTAFGSTDTPTTSGADATGTANTMAQWVIQYGLDGIDVDYEDFDAMNSGTAEAWLVTFTKQLRTQLPQGQYIVTHAPVAPWFSPNLWTNGGYLQIDSEVGDLIDWYNVQFYNQGDSEYNTCDDLLNTSGGQYPSSSLFEISGSGVSLDKLLIGKPATTGDASTGYMDPSTLAGCVSQAKSGGWDGGVMVWQYPDGNAAWIETVRAQSWPV